MPFLYRLNPILYRNGTLFNNSNFLHLSVLSYTCRCSHTMNKPRVYITRSGCPPNGIQLLKDNCDIEMWNNELEPVPRKELLERVKGICGLFCLLSDKIDKEVLDAAGPSLKVIGTMSVGYDHIDITEVKKRGIKLGYTPGVLTDAVAELTVALLLATSRRLFEANEELVNGGWGSWSPLWLCGSGLAGSTVGIVGLGRIGQEVAKRLKTFNPEKILYTARSDKKEATQFCGIRVEFDELLSNSDFVIVTCSLNPETKGMFNDEAFSKMKPSAIFVNTSRGDIVDQIALCRALQNCTIKAAGLDVMTPEPLPLNDPLIGLKNCVLLPHIGSATTKAREEMCLFTARNILNGLADKPLLAEVK